MNGGTTTTWRLVSLSPLPAWALGLLTVLVLAGVVLAVLGLRREPSALRRRVLLVLRLLAGAMALFFLLEPGLRQLAQVPGEEPAGGAGGPEREHGLPGAARTVRPGRRRRPRRWTASPRGSRRCAIGTRWRCSGFSPELAPVSSEALRDPGQREPDRPHGGAAGAQGHRHRRAAGSSPARFSSRTARTTPSCRPGSRRASRTSSPRSASRCPRSASASRRWSTWRSRP